MVVAVAQQDPAFTQYMFNNLYYNPGFSGTDGTTKITSLFRSQWTGYEPTFYGGGAPATQMISVSAPIFKLNSGVGGYIMRDNLGPQTNYEIQASGAYHLPMKNSKLSIGLRVGAFSQVINTDLYRVIDENDPNLPTPGTGKYSEIKPDMAAGVAFLKEKYYIGAGFSHLLKSKFEFGQNGRSALKSHAYITGGYFYDLNFDTRVQFVSLVKTDFVKTQFDLGAIAYLRNTMWGGLSFRQSEAVIAILGYSFLKDKSLKLSYSLDYIIKDRAAKQTTSNEVMVSYELPVVPKVGKKVVRTPRYRH